MEERSEPNSLPDHATGILHREAFPFFKIAAQLECPIHQAVHIYFFVDHLSDRDGLTLMDEVASPKFVRREADCFCDNIEMPLESEDALRCAKPAKCTMRRRIRCDGAASD